MTTDIVYWAIFQYDKKIAEKRLVGVYTTAADANVDALALQAADSWVTVELFEVHTESQYSSHEPAVEESAEDFDTPIHVTGEVR